ncbi:MAG: DUF1320 domain-containing protein [Bacteroidota bacterium]|nr:DUF1320 domain-containing protein [Bacteroidota bacterium]
MYLIQSDYKKQIQSDNLNQIIGSDTSILHSAELTAIEEVQSYLVQKYDLINEFQSLFVFDSTAIYKANTRVYLDANTYSNTASYVVGNSVIYSGNYYICKGNMTGTFDTNAWTLINSQYTIYYAQYPFPVFDYNTQYIVGDKVFWQDKTYTCLIATQALCENSALQYGTYQNIPLLNVVPNNINNGSLYWNYESSYFIPANTSISNANYWTVGDNRSQQLVTFLIDITLYHLHSRISPRNIPDLRIKRYDDAKSWLKAVGKGDVTANLPMLKPSQGSRIRYGGSIKQINFY